MIIIGLTGRSGSGKGFISLILNELNIQTIDTDMIYHNMTSKPSPCLDELIGHFGDDIINGDKSLNRAKLSDIVFNSKNELEHLNRITHKYILNETVALIDKYSRLDNAFVVIDAPLLYESGFNKLCDYTVCAYVSDDIAVKRITERDNISKEKALNRLNSQKTVDEFLSLTDYLVNTDKSEKDIRNELLLILKDIERKESLKSE